jgi:hypothetical protein
LNFKHQKDKQFLANSRKKRLKNIRDFCVYQKKAVNLQRNMSMRIGNSILPLLLGSAAWVMVACQPTPQRARHLGKEQEVDSTLMAHMQLNMRLSDAADRACSAVAESDSLRYTMDDFGFWYTKTISNAGEELKVGEEAVLHIQLNELNGSLIADTKSSFIVGAGDLPLAITRSSKMMSRGEQMKIISPWYTAYGVEGTNIIKPYTNLLITLTVEE